MVYTYLTIASTSSARRIGHTSRNSRLTDIVPPSPDCLSERSGSNDAWYSLDSFTSLGDEKVATGITETTPSTFTRTKSTTVTEDTLTGPGSSTFTQGTDAFALLALF